MLAAHANDIAEALNGEQAKRKRQPRFRSDLMRSLELLDFLIGSMRGDFCFSF
jgi:hypothetical protein